MTPVALIPNNSNNQRTHSLYIHFPWCIQKCPYCDFNSHNLNTKLPEDIYINRLISEIDETKHFWPKDKLIETIFMGGGTPSLFSSKSLSRLFEKIYTSFNIAPHCEITIEVNPGASTDLVGYRSIGINRISIGVQSFQPHHLKKLGRIHSNSDAVSTIQRAQKSGFDNINIDLMYGLPNQSLREVSDDLICAIQLNTNHISWYQLTLEPNTLFYAKPPPMPNDDTTADMRDYGIQTLIDNQFYQYEISAFTKDKTCHHNVNYWLFGDYLGIGAGAHSKWSSDIVQRRIGIKHPKQYLMSSHATLRQYDVPIDELLFEYFLNRSRMPGCTTISEISSAIGWLPDKILQHCTHPDLSAFLKCSNQENITLSPLCHDHNSTFLEQLLLVKQELCDEKDRH